MGKAVEVDDAAGHVAHVTGTAVVADEGVVVGSILFLVEAKQGEAETAYGKLQMDSFGSKMVPAAHKNR